MNPSKVREYFSAYHEGELEGGLRQQFEQALSDRPEMQAEFSDFVASITLLESSQSEEIEVPVDLHDKICARLDLQDWEAKRSAKSSFFGNWKLAVFGGLGILGIAAAIVTLQPKQGDYTMAGLTPVSKQAPVADVEYRNNEIRLVLPAGIFATATITDSSSTEPLQVIELNGRPLDAPISNVRDSAGILKVDFENKAQGITVSLPGKSGDLSPSGSGNAEAYALAVSQNFRAPVIVRVKDMAKEIEWNFSEVEDLRNLPSSLAESGWTLTERSDGFLILTD